MPLLAPASPFDPPSIIYIFLTQPIKFLIRLLDLTFSAFRTLPKRQHSQLIRIVCISDTHCLKPNHVPDGDLLIHAGDLTNAGTPSELQAQIDWLDSLPHEHKIAIAGNHDTYLDPRSRETLAPPDRDEQLDWKSIRYLQHSSASLKFRNGRQLKLFGAPQIPACGGPEFAFQYERGKDAWSETVPLDTDVLVTHTPPKSILDLPAALGCEHLLSESRRVQPLLHVFGHVHAGKTDWIGWLQGGKQLVRWDEGQESVNRALNRPDGLLRGLVDPRSWLDLARVLYYGISGLLWDNVWGGESPSTLMVNASLMYNNTGELVNPPQVVDI